MGAPFEARFGAPETIKLLAVATIAAGVAGAISTFVLGGVVFGSGPWLMALITGYAATIPPGAQLSLLGIVPMKRNTLIGAIVVFTFLASLIEGTWAAFIADMAALAGAWFWMKWRLTPRRPRPKKKKNGSGSGRFRVIKGGLDDDDDERPKYLN